MLSSSFIEKAHFDVLRCEELFVNIISCVCAILDNQIHKMAHIVADLFAHGICLCVFVFANIPASDLPEHVRERVETHGGGALLEAEHPLDVVAILKRRAADADICQNPVLVVPYNRISLLDPLPLLVTQRVKHKLSYHWLELAEALVKELGTESAARTSRYLCQLATGQLFCCSLPDLPFLRKSMHGECLANDMYSAHKLQESLKVLAPAMHFKCNVKKLSVDKHKL